jgi:phosphoribosylaminoimidazole-succinocarboxamide synthase
MEHEFMGLEGQEIPEMPEAFVQEVSDRYIDLFERVTGQAFKRLPLEHLEKDIEVAVNQWIKEH